MKRFIFVCAALCLLLSGCANAAPKQTADGAAWDEDWVTLGGVLGVGEPGNDLALRDNNAALSADDLYLASWTIGEGAPYVNEDGDEVSLYPARLDVLVYGRGDAAAAARTLDDWSARQTEVYAVRETTAWRVGGQDYTVSSYDCPSETNPYSRGVSAFLVYGDYALSFELNCQEGFAGDEAEILRSFLDACHYAA